jgi:hypothetical protein
MIQFADIDLDHGFLRVQSKPEIGFHVKNYQHRYIPLGPQARQAVEAQWLKKHVDSDFVFHRPDGSPWGDIGPHLMNWWSRPVFRRKRHPSASRPIPSGVRLPVG